VEMLTLACESRVGFPVTVTEAVSYGP
jgi:hypothetical protein